MKVEGDLTTLEGAQELYETLRGGPMPKGWCAGTLIKLSANRAFSIIHFLQEQYHVIPTSFEVCAKCDRIFDSSDGGYLEPKSGKSYCQSCEPAHAWYEGQSVEELRKQLKKSESDWERKVLKQAIVQAKAEVHT